MEHTDIKLEAREYMAPVGRWRLADNNGDTIAEIPQHIKGAKAKAERLVLCWNEHDKLKAKVGSHDKLLDACKEALHLITNHSEGNHRAFIECENNLKLVIAENKK